MERKTGNNHPNDVGNKKDERVDIFPFFSSKYSNLFARLLLFCVLMRVRIRESNKIKRDLQVSRWQVNDVRGNGYNAK